MVCFSYNNNRIFLGAEGKKLPDTNKIWHHEKKKTLACYYLSRLKAMFSHGLQYVQWKVDWLDRCYPSCYNGSIWGWFHSYSPTSRSILLCCNEWKNETICSERISAQSLHPSNLLSCCIQYKVWQEQAYFQTTHTIRVINCVD